MGSQGDDGGPPVPAVGVDRGTGVVNYVQGWRQAQGACVLDAWAKDAVSSADLSWPWTDCCEERDASGEGIRFGQGVEQKS